RGRRSTIPSRCWPTSRRRSRTSEEAELPPRRAAPRGRSSASSVTLLWSYLRRHLGLVALALALAAINQLFSLADPLIFRYVIDNYATRYQEYTPPQFIRGVSLLLLAAVGVAFVSRVAKNF